MNMKNQSLQSYGAFDYVIVGAGSAGCTLANRLTEDPNVSVCLLEAGGPDKDPRHHAPIGFAFFNENSPINWSFEPEPQAGLGGRTGFHPRGKVLGGSSSINAMIYIRGTQADYDGWVEDGAHGWGYEDVLPYFKKAQNQERGENAVHGVGGPLNVADLRYKNPISELFLEAAAECQYPITDEFNGGTQEGIGFYQVTQKNGRRCSTAKGYLEPARERNNLTVISNAQATKIAMADKVATGVEFLCGKKRYVADANREVICAAGAYQSPQLLMLSGIGAGDHLKQNGVEVVHDSPQIGKNLQDHVDYCLLNKTSHANSVGFSLNTAKKLIPAFRAYKKDGQGLFTSNLAEAGGFVKTSPSEDAPDIQFHFIPGIVDDHGRKTHLGGGVSCHICVLRPRSRGEIRLKNSDPLSPPAIDPNYFSDENGDDLARTIKGTRLAQKILSAPAFKPILGKSIYLEDPEDDAALLEDIRNRADTIYHPVGTCRMGSDKDAVVDTSLRVNGVKNLRVIDASIMPRLISGNTNAPTIMIAEKAADEIKRTGF